MKYNGITIGLAIILLVLIIYCICYPKGREKFEFFSTPITYQRAQPASVLPTYQTDPQLTLGTNKGWDSHSKTLWKIPSLRKPFAVEYLVNPYGGMQTRLGTDLGTLPSDTPVVTLPPAKTPQYLLQSGVSPV